MKFSNGCWMQKEGTEIFSPAQVYFVKKQDQNPGDTDQRYTCRELTICAPTHKINHRGDTLGGVNLTLRISTPMPEVFRIQVDHYLGVQKRSPEFELDMSKESLLSVEESEELLMITSGSLRLEINKNNWKMTFFRGNEKITDSSWRDLAYVKTNWRGLAYDDGSEQDTYMRERLSLSVGELIYGLGERFTPFIKNGQTVDIWNEDGGTSTEQSYKNIPFYISNKGYGVFVNHPGKVSFEVGSEMVKKVQFSVPGEGIDYFLINGPSMKEVLMRHTEFDGNQVVVHNRLNEVHEVFSYNLYPGPSAKKGIYGVLLNIGEQEGWLTAHASTVKVITPYDNEIVIMHEGASGGGKSEMIEPAHRAADGRLILGENLSTGEKYYLDLSESCELHPVTDDMALCHPQIQNESKKLVVQDAESGWFLRLDNVTSYGSSPQYEKIFTQPKEPLLFLNIQGVPNATCLVWEHTLDSNGTPCPNPRAILPRRLVPDIVSNPVEVDVRSFGVRTPPCTKENPSYGILGMFHILPPALAWLWRLVAPRGYNNPSIVNTKGMTSEGVGSYWPFATGKMVKQANLLLEQILRSTSTRYLLIPNQHIGVYEVSFNPQWVAREYIARRGSAKFKPEHLKEARCTLLGYGLESLKVDGQYIRRAFLQPERQQEVGIEGYDAGAKILLDFFKREVDKFNTEELHPIGKQIIECLLRDAPLQDYIDIIPMRF